jgi:ADP-ribose pyrophosphatase YjhB (NUDIX family)
MSKSTRIYGNVLPAVQVKKPYNVTTACTVSVLLYLRSKKGGFYRQLTTKVKQGEDLTTAAVRLVYKEAGWKIEKKNLISTGKHPLQSNDLVIKAFFCTLNKEEARKLYGETKFQTIYLLLSLKRQLALPRLKKALESYKEGILWSSEPSK